MSPARADPACPIASIDFYFDFSSPYGYLAAQKIERSPARYERAVEWRPMLLGVIFKQTGAVPLTEVPVKGAYAKRDFARSARFHGIEFRMPPVFPIPSQAPARIVLWAKARNPRTARARPRRSTAPSSSTGSTSPSRTRCRRRRRPASTVPAARAAIDDPAIKDAFRREVKQAIAAGVFGSP